jgi:SCF-associated factor 1
LAQTTKKEVSGDYANLGSYFPVAIAAAGWHSGALVLVDEDKTHETRSKWVAHRQQDNDEDKTRSMPGSFESLEPDEVYLWKKDGFPKVRLPNGFEMPGDGEPRPWREGMPTMRELGLE